MYSCKNCKRFWHYELRQCAYCQGDLVREEAKKWTVVGVTEVSVPSTEHPDVPYWVLLLEDEKGNKRLRKSMEAHKIGDSIEVGKAKGKLPHLGVVGTGPMAFGLVLTALKSGMPVTVKSRNRETLDKLKQSLTVSLTKTGGEEAAHSALKLLTLSTEYADLKKCDLVVENVVEKLDVKRQVFAELEKYCGPKTILASNTSSLLVSSMTGALKSQERVIGMHFFNPVDRMRLVEVIAGPKTSQATKSKTNEIALLLGKTPIETKDAPGFIVNRVLFPLLNEAILLLEEKVALPSDIDNAVKLGLNHPMGPLALTDLIGLDVFVEIMDNLKAETGDAKFTAAKLARTMVREGKLGRKTKQGFYKY